MTTCSRRLFLLGTATTFAGAYLAACGKELITKIEGMTATCTSHYSSFDLGSGEVTGGPSPKPLTEYGVENDGGTIKNVSA